MKDKQYIIVVQCHIVMERCSGYFCEKAFHERSGLFKCYPQDISYRTLYLTCGGCCGRAVQRKLLDLLRSAEKKEGIKKDTMVVHLSTCIVKESFHGPKCPHLDYLRDLIQKKAGFDLVEGTRISDLSEKRREGKIYSYSS